jgi:hypothetical protein
MIEERYVIKFLLEEGETGIEIHPSLTERYRGRAMSRSEMYGWVRDIKGERTDLETISSPGRTRTPEEGLADGIRKRIDQDPHLSAPEIAQSLSLGIAISTFCHYLRHVTGMKCCHLRCIPHTSPIAQKDERQDLATCMLEILVTHVVSSMASSRFDGPMRGRSLCRHLPHPSLSLKKSRHFNEPIPEGSGRYFRKQRWQSAVSETKPEKTPNGISNGFFTTGLRRKSQIRSAPPLSAASETQPMRQRPFF